MVSRPSINALTSTLTSLRITNNPNTISSIRRTVYTISNRKKKHTPSTIAHVKTLQNNYGAPPLRYSNDKTSTNIKRFYKQQNLGLYGGLTIRTGHNVSHKTETKTRRAWRPNIQHKRLWSHALGKFLHLKVATRVLRTIDKSGGLDDYLLGEKRARIEELGMHGWLLRWRVMQTPLIQARFAEQRRILGEKFGFVLENPLVKPVPLLQDPASLQAENADVLVDENGEPISEEERDAKVASIDRDLERAERMAERERLTVAEDRSFMVEEAAPPKQEVTR